MSFFEGRKGTPFTVLVAVDDAAQWLCDENMCILFGANSEQMNEDDIKDLRHRCYIDLEPIHLIKEFIELIEKILKIRINCLRKVILTEPLQYTDDISLLTQVNKLLLDPENCYLKSKTSFEGNANNH